MERILKNQRQPFANWIQILGHAKGLSKDGITAKIEELVCLSFTLAVLVIGKLKSKLGFLRFSHVIIIMTNSHRGSAFKYFNT